MRRVPLAPLGLSALLCALALPPDAAAGDPSMAFEPAPVHTGVVIAAPHEGFDSHTAPMAQGIAEALGAGWVTATNFRQTRLERWFDVNRPTQSFWVDGRRGRGEVTDQARQVYAAYQARVDKASGRTPLQLLVEIHGHARRASINGQTVKVQVIELATRGFSEGDLRQLKARYERLQRELSPADRVPLAVEQLDEVYEYQGAKLEFYFGASGSKQAGSLSAERTQRALHFECPSDVRFDPERRALYTQLFAKLLAPLLKD